MSVKFQRNYIMEITNQQTGLTEIIQFPLTCDFQVERNSLSSSNTATFTVWNLSDTTRDIIKKSALNLYDYRTINFYAGYGQNLPLVFSGQVLSCVSSRESVDWMTIITCQDPGIPITNDVSVSLNAGSSRASNIENVVNKFMAPIQFGKCGGLFNDNPTLIRGNSYSGSVLDVCKQMTNGNFYIDNGKAYVLAPNEYLPDEGYPLVNASTGLLGSPSYDGVCNYVNVVFEPRIVMSQNITLDSQESFLNGTFKVIAFSHHGRISLASAGDAITEITMYDPKNSAGLEVLVAANP